jgi:hypothetical protein
MGLTYLVSYTSGYRYMIIFLLPSFTSSICNFYILILCTWSYVADSLTTISGMQIIAFPVSELLLFKANSAIFQLFWWWEQFNFQWDPLCTRPTRLNGFFIVLAHWNNSPWIDLLTHCDTLPWFQANEPVFALFP